jgi:hypothetical protein
VEEESFQEKLWDALDDDDRLGGIEARLNEYAYVPRRWRGVSSQAYSPDSVGGLDDHPNFMNDDEYAEWVRVGMWRCVLPNVRTNEDIHEEHLTESAMPRNFRSSSGKGRLTQRRRLKPRKSSGQRRMPVGARDMSGNAGGVQMPEMHINYAGLGCSNQDQNLQIWASEIYRGRCGVHHRIYPRLRLRLFLLSSSSLGRTRRGERGRARRNLEGRCCVFTQINLKGG